MARGRFVLLALLVAAAAPLRAQSLAAEPSVPLAPSMSAPAVESSAPVGPAVSSQRTAAHVAESNAPLKAAMPANAGLGQARAMMVVGAAAFVAGAIIGGTPGTIIMVGVGVIGLVGLYDYLQ